MTTKEMKELMMEDVMTQTEFAKEYHGYYLKSENKDDRLLWYNATATEQAKALHTLYLMSKLGWLTHGQYNDLMDEVMTEIWKEETK